MPNKKSAFTLVELLIVVSVLGILASITIVLINPVAMQNRARDGVMLSNFEKIVSSINSYHNVYGEYPDPSDTNCDGSNDSQDCSVISDISGAVYFWNATNVAANFSWYIFDLEMLPVVNSPNRNNNHEPGRFQYIQRNGLYSLTVTSYSDSFIYAWRSDLGRIQVCTFDTTLVNPGVFYIQSSTNLTCEDV